MLVSRYKSNCHYYLKAYTSFWSGKDKPKHYGFDYIKDRDHGAYDSVYIQQKASDENVSIFTKPLFQLFGFLRLGTDYNNLLRNVHCVLGLN